MVRAELWKFWERGGGGGGGGGAVGKVFFFFFFFFFPALTSGCISHVGATLCCRMRRGQLRRAALSLVYNMFY